MENTQHRSDAPRRTRVPRRWLTASAIAASLVAVPLGAQQMTVTSDLPRTGFVDPTTPIRITPDRVPTEGERIAVMVGDQDVTALLAYDGATFTYRPGAFALPAGAHEVRVFLVDPRGTWRDLARFPLRVRGALGFEERRITPGMDVSLESQPAQGHTPLEAEPERATYGQLDGELRLGVEQVHAAAALGADVRLVGTSHQEDALRFFRQGADAPKVDLSSYAMRLQSEPVKLTVGSVQFGEERHLVNGIGGRGARLDLGHGKVDGSLAASSPTPIVGWENLLGLGESDNRILAANLGLDVLTTPGALRVDASWMSGRTRPVSGFNQGALTDREESDGFSVRLRTNALRGRMRLDVGYAESRFTNPKDELLSQGVELVDVRRTRKNARYVDADLDVLRNVALWGREKARVSVGYRHERVEPLYRTVGTYVRSDVLTDRYDVRADVSWLTLSGSFGRGEDNLDRIPSVLTTRTDRAAFTAALPLHRGAGWLPTLNYRLDRTHQLGLGLPVGGGFDPSHVPDQVSLNHTANATWQSGRMQLGLQLGIADQDNRQPGRENADFLTRRSSVQLGLTPIAVLSLGLDLAQERRENRGADDVSETRRWGLSMSWRALRSSSLSVSYSDTFQDNAAATFERGDRVLTAGWSSFVPAAERFGGQYFLRFNYQSSRDEDLLRAAGSDRMFWTIQLGLSLSAGRR